MELGTRNISRELGSLQAHLHEAVKKGDIAEKAAALEAELASIIDGARSYTEQLESLMEFSSILNSSLDPARVREESMKATCRLLRAEAATLFLLDSEKSELVSEASVGDVNSVNLTETRLPIDAHSSAGLAALGRRSVSGEEEGASVLCATLETKAGLHGVLQATRKKPFSEAELRLLETLAHQVAIAVENAALFENLQNQFQETAMALATAIEAKDRYTGGHTRRVAHFAELIGKHMGLDRRLLHEVRLSAILHDVGKIGIDDSVLKKDGPLDALEWEHMKQHPELGWKILANVKCMKNITDGMRFHHERPDGHGYPKRLKGEEIPLIARIISVADTFDAMTSNRPYRKGLNYETAFEEILRHKGSQFDEKVVDGFARAFKLERMGKKRAKERP